MKYIVEHKILNLYAKFCHEDLFVRHFGVAIEYVYNIVDEHLLIILFELILKVNYNRNVIVERWIIGLWNNRERQLINVYILIMPEE
jgi:hypothetical protein